MWYQLIKIIVKEIKGRITAKENKVKGNIINKDTIKGITGLISVGSMIENVLNITHKTKKAKGK